MDKVYAISYDLHRPGQDYAPLIEELKRSTAWWHYLGSTWLIRTSETPNQLWQRISSHIDEDDRALIIEVRRNYSGWLPKDAWKWIEENIPATSEVW